MIVVLDNLRSALNVGSIIRTCDAFGIEEVYFCGITPDSSHKKVLKTSLGAEENIKGHISSSTAETINKLKEEGYKIIGLEIDKNSIDIKGSREEKEIVLVVGNEISGISEDVKELCDELVKIPMKGVKESLNVAVSFGIAVYHYS